MFYSIFLINKITINFSEEYGFTNYNIKYSADGVQFA